MPSVSVVPVGLHMSMRGTTRSSSRTPENATEESEVNKRVRAAEEDTVSPGRNTELFTRGLRSGLS